MAMCLSPPDAAVRRPRLQGLRFVNEITGVKCQTSELAWLYRTLLMDSLEGAQLS
jgi:hypothetical protein